MYFINEELQKELDNMSNILEEALYVRKDYDEIDYCFDLAESDLSDIINEESVSNLNESAGSLEDSFSNMFLDQLAKGDTLTNLSNGSGLSMTFLGDDPGTTLSKIVLDLTKSQKFSANDIIAIVDKHLHDKGFDTEEQDYAISIIEHIQTKVQIFSRKGLNIKNKLKIVKAIKDTMKTAKEDMKLIISKPRRMQRAQTIQLVTVILNVSIHLFKQKEKFKHLMYKGMKSKLKI